MAKNDPGNVRYQNNLPEGLNSVLDGLARVLFYGGLAAAVVGCGVLLWQFFGSGGATPDQITAALNYQGMFKQASLLGMLAACLGALWLFWGEEVCGPIMLIVGFALALMSWYVPMMAPQAANELQGKALQGLVNSGYPAIGVGFLAILADVITRTRMRVKLGAKAEQLKYGKGVKEERDIRNVFMGKCWQLPYCRKFVRERCPIYHSKRTCWKERVGCMCEESVIKNAMDNKVIPADIVAASKFIPQNHKLSAAQKAERCRQCVIYNEHQKHKYSLMLPVVSTAVIAVFAVMWQPLAMMIQGGLSSIDRIYQTVTITQSPDVKASVQATSVEGGVIPYHYIILFVLALVSLAYTVKILEYLIWKLKI